MTASFGLLTYLASPEYNAGDYIQSLAAAQFLPRIDKYVNREKLNDYKGPSLKLIMNGWFMHRPANWPPAPQIHPLLISFHLNSQARDGMLDRKGVDWLRQHEAVGCRDEHTQHILNAHGIDTYYSGCLTGTFENKFAYRTGEIYFADVLFRVPGWSTSARTPREFLKAIISGEVVNVKQRSRLMNELFDSELILKAKTISHYHPARHNEKERFAVAEELLKKYATAKLVITSRLHCALPCLAFGTPVIFVHYGFKKEFDTCRLKGITDLFNTIYIDDKEQVSANFSFDTKISEEYCVKNPHKFKETVSLMREKCMHFVNEVFSEA